MRAGLCIIAFLVAALLRVCAIPSAPDEFPFDFHDGFLWVQVNVAQSSHPLNFLLDTGASVSAINLDSAHRLNLRLGAPVSVQGVESSATGYWPQRLNAKANGVRLANNYLAVDLGTLGQACNCCVDGLIGSDFFRGKVVQIDFSEHKIRLLGSAAKLDGQTVIGMKMWPGGIEVPIAVDGGEPRFVRLDTGCASALQWVRAGTEPTNCPQRLAVALSQFKVSEILSRVRLGNVELQSVPTGLHSEDIFAGEAGLLGNGILSRFKTVTVDAIHGRLILGGRN